jgi:hypothetical protein
VVRLSGQREPIAKVNATEAAAPVDDDPAADDRPARAAVRADRVEGVLESAPGPVAEADACRRRMDPPRLPTQSIEWCGVIWAVHLALSMQHARGEVTASKLGLV